MFTPLRLVRYGNVFCNVQVPCCCKVHVLLTSDSYAVPLFIHSLSRASEVVSQLPPSSVFGSLSLWAFQDALCKSGSPMRSMAVGTLVSWVVTVSFTLWESALYVLARNRNKPKIWCFPRSDSYSACCARAKKLAQRGNKYTYTDSKRSWFRHVINQSIYCTSWFRILMLFCMVLQSIYFKLTHTHATIFQLLTFK